MANTSGDGPEQFREKARGAAFPALQVIFGVAVLVLVVLVATNNATTSDAWTIVGLAVLAGVVAVIRTGPATRLLGRLSKLSIGPIAMDLREEIKDVVGVKARADTDDSLTTRLDIVYLQLKLEWKLAYIAKEMLNEPVVGANQGSGVPTSGFATIGSLFYDKYLSEDEARVARQLMTLRPEDLDSLSASERTEFLGNADTLVSRIRGSVLRGMVADVLRKEDWRVDDLPREPNQARPDYRATRDNAKVMLRVAPVFSETRPYAMLSAATERLRRTATDREERSLIVLQQASDAPTDPNSNPPVIKIGELRATLNALQTPTPGPNDD